MCVLGGHLAKINFAKMACAVEKELFHYSGSMRNEKDNFVYHSEEKKNFLLLLSQRLAKPKKWWWQSNVVCSQPTSLHMHTKMTNGNSSKPAKKKEKNLLQLWKERPKLLMTKTAFQFYLSCCIFDVFGYIFTAFW